MTRRHWTAADKALLAQRYADTQSEDIARALGCSLSQVYSQAYRMGLEKSPAYLAGVQAGRIQKGQRSAAMQASQFQPGLVPWNKGVKGVVGTQDACKATQFKPGRAPCESRNYRPLGSLRITHDGYLERKFTDDTNLWPARRWVAEHRRVWEDKNGPVPSGSVVVFLRGKRTTDPERITLDVLELVTRRTLMLRNSIANVPPELLAVTYLRAQITRQINQRTKDSA